MKVVLKECHPQSLGKDVVGTRGLQRSFVGREWGRRGWGRELAVNWISVDVCVVKEAWSW